ncbi:hypothetical protein IC619_016495 [Hazenella sp. IB182353]|uniref:hypothetical protein n=1 Tax=Polycladospora coralii TaxID=2771432 RepID=UPI0017471019|nr:hypothetical protein [Polycladospora coralii]MBS7532040.1 hypothetical protein [Polycladospora coralii]
MNISFKQTIRLLDSMNEAPSSSYLLLLKNRLMGLSKQQLHKSTYNRFTKALLCRQIKQPTNVDNNPSSIAVSGDGSNVIVTLSGKNKVGLITTNNETFQGKKPLFIATLPAPNNL